MIDHDAIQRSDKAHDVRILRRYHDSVYYVLSNMIAEELRAASEQCGREEFHEHVAKVRVLGDARVVILREFRVMFEEMDKEAGE